MDVIVSARDIARAAESLDKIAWHITEQCPDQQCCRDLQAYLGQIKLYCHQLKITAAVKADLNTSMRETVSKIFCPVVTSLPDYPIFKFNIIIGVWERDCPIDHYSTIYPFAQQYSQFC